MVYHFNNLTLDTVQYRISSDSGEIAIEPQAFNILLYLIEHRDKVVSRDELLNNLWKGKVVTDSALGSSLKAVRKAVGDSGSEQSVIKTIHGRGYQFVAAVSASDDQADIPTTAVPDYPELPDTPSIAVLPFVNLSGDPEQEFFSDGLTEDIIAALTRISNLLIVASHSTRNYKNTSTSLKMISKEQGVRYVLEGSVRKSGPRIRVTTKLNDAVSGFQTWAENYDRELDDIFAVQDDITRNVTLAMQVQFQHGEQARVWAKGTSNVKAWELAIRALEFHELEIREPNLEGRRLAEQALAIDPNYAFAWMVLGFTYWADAYWGWESDAEESIQKAEEAGRKALALDEACAEAWVLISQLQILRKEFDASVESANRALALAPSNSHIAALSGDAYCSGGLLKEGIQQIQRGMRLSPQYPPWYITCLGVGYEDNNELELAIDTYRTALKIDKSVISDLRLASALIKTGDLEQAKLHVAKVIQQDPTFFKRPKCWWFEVPSDVIRESGMIGDIES